ncbi:hypothetical protein BDZ94DRAFT_28887 [Collybia nuda]|uniref:Thioredoxin domain-containing protein n=1 Tax=Collybia nuda TaxID=64659 RepID=A0A9P5YH48_9AGAR|nr:hypothetical protein BDZ94DRAFT_28887 [Collybia nuda]
MPLRISQEPIDSQSLKAVEEEYIIFYSSIVDGQSWCPDCRNVEDLVQNTFGTSDGPSGVIVYVGDRLQWKSPSNVFRNEPWNLTDIPTIVRLQDGTERSRIVEKEIPEGLKTFIEG